ncbi:MAG: alpha/beta hydrolase, partial [Muribaculaceae bacterium]|nr:alpha/beta hydrolase [Muribaculaceae bacterium]
MKRGILAVFNFLAGILWVFSQSGVWSGDLNVQATKLPLVFHLDDNNPTVDSPAQGVRGIPIQVTKKDSENITINIPSIGASFEGKFDKGRISGVFTQRGAEFPLVLVSGEKT